MANWPKSFCGKTLRGAVVQPLLADALCNYSVPIPIYRVVNCFPNSVVLLDLLLSIAHTTKCEFNISICGYNGGDEVLQALEDHSVDFLLFPSVVSAQQIDRFSVATPLVLTHLITIMSSEALITLDSGVEIFLRPFGPSFWVSVISLCILVRLIQVWTPGILRKRRAAMFIPEFLFIIRDGS